MHPCLLKNGASAEHSIAVNPWCLFLNYFCFNFNSSMLRSPTIKFYASRLICNKISASSQFFPSMDTVYPDLHFPWVELEDDEDEVEMLIPDIFKVSPWGFGSGKFKFERFKVSYFVVNVGRSDNGTVD